ncbi:hypothetical protein MAR_016064 [Mya arenaria]|uniref:Transmembrane protein n=1 Tax=Mya arenaria TaxID=6604 RepID=A0ABY7FIT1_MYAAR|nr:hypothetical protein MAR_016064 [Mya arenaria]
MDVLVLFKASTRNGTERLIPIWLIVSGVAPIFFSGTVRKPKGEEGKEETETETGGCAHVARSICGAIALVFNLAWLICGSVWIYPTYGKVNEDGFTPCAGNVTTGCSDDCHKPTLTFAFAMVTMDWIFFAFWLIAIGCSVRQVLAKAKESQNLNG